MQRFCDYLSQGEAIEDADLGGGGAGFGGVWRAGGRWGQQVGVAYLALSLHLEGNDQVTPSPRNIPVRIPPGMYQMAVVRIDGPQSYSAMHRELAARMIGEMARFTHPRGLLIDFDAPREAWPFYRELLSAVRATIGGDVWLSMTALVSWCGGEFIFEGCRGGLGVTVGPNYGSPAARPRNGERTYFIPERNQWPPELLMKALDEYLA